VSLPTFEPLFTRNTPKRGVFLTSVRPVWVILEVLGDDIHEAVQSEAVYIGELRRGVEKGVKKGSFGVIWGQKGLF
jgi:hypothetical protein